MLDFEDRLMEGVPARRRRVSRQYLSTNSRHDPEMGFLPMLAAAIPMVANLAGSLLSKKSSKGGGPPPEANTAQNVLDVLTKAIGGDESNGENSIKEVVRNIVATVPSPVLKQVKEGIQQLRNADKAQTVARDLIVQKVDSKFGPQIHALLAATKAAQLQKQATYEHNKIKSRESFRKNTTNTLKSINERLAFIERRLANSAVVQGQERMQVFGGKRVLER